MPRGRPSRSCAESPKSTSSRRSSSRLVADTVSDVSSQDSIPASQTSTRSARSQKSTVTTTTSKPSRGRSTRKRSSGPEDDKNGNKIVVDSDSNLDDTVLPDDSCSTCPEETSGLPTKRRRVAAHDSDISSTPSTPRRGRSTRHGQAISRSPSASSRSSFNGSHTETPSTPIENGRGKGRKSKVNDLNNVSDQSTISVEGVSQNSATPPSSEENKSNVKKRGRDVQSKPSTQDSPVSEEKLIDQSSSISSNTLLGDEGNTPATPTVHSPDTKRRRPDSAEVVVSASLSSVQPLPASPIHENGKGNGKGNGKSDVPLRRPGKRDHPTSPPLSPITDRPGKLLKERKSPSPPSPRQSNGSVIPKEVIVPEEKPVDVWENWTDCSSGCDPLVDRVWTSRPLSTSSNNTLSTTQVNDVTAARSDREFVVLSYNILSDAHVKPNPVNQKLSDLEQPQRHKLLMREILFIDSDVLCLQEVGPLYFKTLLQPDMKSRGFVGHLSVGPDSNDDGLAIFYRTSRFKAIEQKVIPLKSIADAILGDVTFSIDVKRAIQQYLDAPRDLQLMLLSCSSTGRLLCVGNLQTSSSSLGSVKSDLHCVQVAGALWQINEFLIQNAPVARLSGKSSSVSTPAAHNWVLCGDLGVLPQSPAYQVARDGYPTDHSLAYLQKIRNIKMPGFPIRQSLVNLLWRAFQHPYSDSVSCYQSLLGREPPMTVNQSGGSQGCSDYIWTGGCSPSAALQPTAVLLPRCHYLRQNRDRLPNSSLPSAHSSIACRFLFTN